VSPLLLARGCCSLLERLSYVRHYLYNLASGDPFLWRQCIRRPIWYLFASRLVVPRTAHVVRLAGPIVPRAFVASLSPYLLCRGATRLLADSLRNFYYDFRRVVEPFFPPRRLDRAGLRRPRTFASWADGRVTGAPSVGSCLPVLGYCSVFLGAAGPWAGSSERLPALFPIQRGPCSSSSERDTSG